MNDERRERLDKWLFFARLSKSRSLATKLVASGAVRLNRRKIEQPSQPVRPGDVLTIAAHDRIRIMRVLDTGTRRGPASEARLLYEELGIERNEVDDAPAPGPLRRSPE